MNVFVFLFLILLVIIGFVVFCVWCLLSGIKKFVVDNFGGPKELTTKLITGIIRVFTLAWHMVNAWFGGHKVSTRDVGRLFQKRLANGEFRVVGGVFSASGQVRQQVTWECSELDDELRRRLSGRSELTVKL
ncbi:hypothetical protein [Geobacter anodireducens]|nr:hypothetical protein RW64_09305 [Geobacter sulfurreducens]